MDRTRLEGPHGYRAFIWRNWRIPMELIIAVLVKVSAGLDEVHRMNGEL